MPPLAAFCEDLAEPELTKDDLEVAEASIRFAMQSCPVEGVLSMDDGSPVSLDDLQSLIEVLEEVEKQKVLPLRLNEDALAQLKGVIRYTSENCPVENVATFHDGRAISGRDIMALAGKLEAH